MATLGWVVLAVLLCASWLHYWFRLSSGYQNQHGNDWVRNSAGDFVWTLNRLILGPLVICIAVAVAAKLIGG